MKIQEIIANARAQAQTAQADKAAAEQAKKPAEVPKDPPVNPLSFLRPKPATASQAATPAPGSAPTGQAAPASQTREQMIDRIAESLRFVPQLNDEQRTQLGDNAEVFEQLRPFMEQIGRQAYSQALQHSMQMAQPIVNEQVNRSLPEASLNEALRSDPILGNEDMLPFTESVVKQVRDANPQLSNAQVMQQATAIIKHAGNTVSGVNPEANSNNQSTENATPPPQPNATYNPNAPVDNQMRQRYDSVAPGAQMTTDTDWLDYFAPADATPQVASQ